MVSLLKTRSTLAHMLCSKNCLHPRPASLQRHFPCSAKLKRPKYCCSSCRAPGNGELAPSCAHRTLCTAFQLFLPPTSCRVHCPRPAVMLQQSPRGCQGCTLAQMLGCSSGRWVTKCCSQRCTQRAQPRHKDLGREATLPVVGAVGVAALALQDPEEKSTTLLKTLAAVGPGSPPRVQRVRYPTLEGRIKH